MKGQVETAGRVAASLVIVLLLLSVALDTGSSIRDKIRIETIDVIGQRIGSAIYMTSGLEEGRTQLNFEEEYGIVEEDNKVYVNFTAGSLALSILEQTGKTRINPPVDFSAEEGLDDNICVIKSKSSSQVQVNQGECD